MKIRILKKLPQFNDNNNKNYGPYNINEIVIIPKILAEYLIESKLGEKVNKNVK